ncbi:MAG: glycosyltransferase [Pirellulaceae bacterium]|nr:glycosyltransferase [Pirellulaceae bacterium]
MPCVSVIVPNYNHARFLPQRLETVLRQSYSDMEVIVLDDASTDTSRDIIMRYADDPRVRVAFRDVNSGNPCSQWNAGVRLATGEFVWIAESDDYADLNLLQTLVQILRQQPETGLVYCESTVVDDENQEVGSAADWSSQVDAERWKAPFTNDGRDECARYFVVQNLIPNASAVVFRRELYNHIGGADETYTMAGDYELWSRMLLNTHLAFTPDRLNYFRAHQASVRNMYHTGIKYIEEDYSILDMIRSRVTVPTASLQLALDRRLNSWAYLHLIQQPRIDWTLNWNVYRRARRSDTTLHRRLASYWHSHLRRVRPHPNRFHA